MTARLVHTIAAAREWTAAARRASRDVGFVPTMGALHEGHASLLRRARAESGAVAVSIFVNPLQFDRTDDLDAYPRTLDADLQTCRELGVDLVFAPTVEEMYPQQPVCTVDVKTVTDHLCGRFRPGHFNGVATVVTKLLQIVQPDRAYFGEKDAQQLVVVRRLVADLDLPVRIVGVPTVREPDGLALSSRNARLSPPERERAPALYRALRRAEQMMTAGERDAGAIARAAAEVVAGEPALRLEYLEIVDPGTLQPVGTIDGPVLVAGAVWAGQTRLIDNLTWTPPARASGPPVLEQP